MYSEYSVRVKKNRVFIRKVLNNQLTSLMAIAVLIAIQWYSLNQIRHYAYPIETDRQRFDIDFRPEFFQWITAGYWPAAADYLWVQSLYRIGVGKDLTLYESDKLEVFSRTAISLDPHYLNWYLDPSIHFAFLNKGPDEANKSKAAVEFAEKGFQHFKQSIYPQVQSGFTKIYDYGDWHRIPTLAIHRGYVLAYIARDWEKAKQAFLDAEQIPNRPAYLGNMSQWLEEEGSEIRLGIRILKILIQSTKDEEKKRLYERELEALLGGRT